MMREYAPLSMPTVPRPDFREEATALFDDMVRVRRDLHRHPELGFQETRTAAIVAETLTGLGLEVQTGVGQTGVVGLLEGERPGPTVLLRFDMDALPIQEESDHDYVSLNPGVMHACGHDGHVAMGLALARIFAARQSQMAGSLKFLFQPAEEGLGGALACIADGVLEEPRPDAALAMHLWSPVSVGLGAGRSRCGPPPVHRPDSGRGTDRRLATKHRQPQHQPPREHRRLHRRVRGRDDVQRHPGAGGAKGHGAQLRHAVAPHGLPAHPGDGHPHRYCVRL